MTKIFVFETQARIFGAFWKNVNGQIYIFLPFESRIPIPVITDHWQKLKNTNSLPFYDADYPELFNIAKWAFEGYTVQIELHQISELKTPLGSFYPRIWRGIPRSQESAGYEAIAPSPLIFAAQKQAIVAATSLFSELLDVFRYIEPNSQNMLCYGHRIRELLILACTEIESQWKSIYILNKSHSSNDKNLSTRDYVKLLTPMRLSEWRVAFKDYINYEFIIPFRDWDIQRPSQSLQWYSAYNSVKHDREGRFDQAQLIHLIQSMAAVHVMMAAQWGPSIFTDSLTGSFSPFHVVSIPRFSAEDQYVCPSAEKNIVLNQAIPLGL